MDWSKASRADALAAAYVTGTLRGAARRRMDALLPGHPALRAAVADWQRRLMPLTLALPPEQPSPAVWRAIEQRLWPKPVAPSLWQRLGLWRAATALSALAAVAALGLALQQPQPSGAPVLVVLQGTGVPAGPGGTIVASLSADGAALVARPLLPVALAPRQVLELWSVPPEGAPRSLGLIAADGVTVLDRARLPARLLKGGTAALAVSLEPPGGSPTGAPTGPVVFAGRFQL